MEKYDAVIIGAGIGGLICAGLLAKRGFKVIVFEKEKKAGGYCRSFSNNGYTFDACVDSIGGLKKHGFLYKILEELAILDKIHVMEINPIRRNIFPDFEIDITSDVKCYKEKLQNLFPTQKKGIDKLFCLMEDIFESLISSVLEESSSANLYYWANRSFKELLDNFVDDFSLKAILSSYCNFSGLSASKVSAIAATCTLMHYLKEGAFRIRGGIQNLVNAIIEAIEYNNGKVVLGEEVSKINITRGKTDGVITSKGRTVKAGNVISNIDVNTLIDSLINHDILSLKKINAIKNLNVSSSFVIVYLGIDYNIHQLNLPTSIGYFSCYDTEAVLNSDNNNPCFGVSIPSFIDDTLAPQDHSSVLIHWPCHQNKQECYDKNIIADKLIDYSERIISGIKKHIIFKKVADSKTFFRYTGNTDGAAYGWEQKPGFLSNISLLNNLSKNLYLVGHWAGYGGGIMPSAISALKVANNITH